MNHFLKETCNHYGNFHYLSNLPLMSSLSTYLYKKDGVHFNASETAALVRMLKSHLNPLLGFKPYEPRTKMSPNHQNTSNLSTGRPSHPISRNRG